MITDPQTLTLTGTNFPSSTNYDIHGSFDSIQATGSFNSATEIVLTFSNGIPVSASLTLPTLSFKSKTTNEELHAITSGATGV